MSFLIYLAIGAILAMVFVNKDYTDAAIPGLYEQYLKQTGDTDLTLESFHKWMNRGLLAAYCCFWPFILMRNLYMLIKNAGKGGGGPKAPQYA